MIKLIAVVVYEHDQRLEAIVEESDGKRRRIDILWKSRDQVPVPSHWWSMVLGEIEFQRTEELNKASGRVQF